MPRGQDTLQVAGPGPATMLPHFVAVAAGGGGGCRQFRLVVHAWGNEGTAGGKAGASSLARLLANLVAVAAGGGQC
jgi:hypothetical protein